MCNIIMHFVTITLVTLATVVLFVSNSVKTAYIFVYNLSGRYSHTSEASNMLFLPICHGVNSVKNHIFVCRI